MILTASFSRVAVGGSMKDAHGDDWTQEELQTLVNHLSSFTKAAARLGIKVQTLRAMGVRTPTEYIREKAQADPQWLPRYVLTHGSIALAAKHLNLSVTFLESVLAQHGYDVRPKLPAKEAIVKALQKFGSVLYVARHFQTSAAHIKKAVPEWRDLTDPTKVGTNSIKTGTIGERFFEHLRGSNILESPATKNRNHPGYDYLDKEYGKVNVKAAPVNSREQWIWEIETGTACDQFALVQLDQARSPIGMMMLPKAQLMSPPEGLTATPRSNGDVAISTKQHHTIPSDPDQSKPPVDVEEEEDKL